MASTEIEIVDPAATVDKLNKIAADRALNRRRFITALGITGAVAGAGLISGCKTTSAVAVNTAGTGQTDILNFALNLEYLQATLYAYLTTGADLPASVTANSGAITGAPAQLAVTGAMTQQIVDLLNEIYFDELNHVIGLRGVLSSALVPRPAINLGALGAITATNALSIARLLKDVGLTAYTGSMAGLSTSNATYAAQILGAESFHSGALRLISIQNPTIAAYIAADSLDVPPADLGSAATEAAGPTASGGFFPTNGAGASGSIAGYTYTRSTSQVLAVLYGSPTTAGTAVVPASSGTALGGFFPSGLNGNITTI
jgi:hypothetical protein